MARRALEENKRRRDPSDQELKPLSSYNKVNIYKEINLEKQLGGVFSLQYNHDASELCAGLSGGGVKLYCPQKGQLIRDLKPNRHGGVAVMAMRYHPKSLDPSWLFAATAEGNIYVIDTRAPIQETKPAVVENKNEINTIDFNSDGYMFATCGRDLNVRIYDTKSCKIVREYRGISSDHIASNPDTESGNTKRVFALKFTENENILLTAGWDDHVKIWDIRTNDGIKRQFHGPHVCGDALDINAGRILTGSWVANKALQEWDYGEGTLIRNINFPHKNGAFLYCAQYGDLGVVLAGGSGTSSVEVIEAATDKLIGSVPMTKAVQAIDSVMGARYFAVGGQDPVLKLCTLDCVAEED